jgi:hypothetical protein
MDHVVTAANLTTETWKAAVAKTFDWYKGCGIIPVLLATYKYKRPLNEIL